MENHQSFTALEAIAALIEAIVAAETSEGADAGRAAGTAAAASALCTFARVSPTPSRGAAGGTSSAVRNASIVRWVAQAVAARPGGPSSPGFNARSGLEAGFKVAAGCTVVLVATAGVGADESA